MPFFPALPHRRSSSELSPRATLILQTGTFMTSSAQPPPSVPLESMGLFVPRSIEGLWGHICIVRDKVTEGRLFLMVLQHDFNLLSLLLLTISCALLEISHLAEALTAFQALELAVHMSPLYVTVHTYGCRYTFWLFRFVCVIKLTQPLRGF